MEFSWDLHVLSIFRAFTGFFSISHLKTPGKLSMFIATGSHKKATLGPQIIYPAVREINIQEANIFQEIQKYQLSVTYFS